MQTSWARLQASGANYVTRGARAVPGFQLCWAPGGALLCAEEIFLKDIEIYIKYIYIGNTFCKHFMHFFMYLYPHVSAYFMQHLLYAFTLCIQLSAASCILYVYSLVQQPVLLDPDTPLGSFGPGADPKRSKAANPPPRQKQSNKVAKA